MKNKKLLTTAQPNWLAQYQKMHSTLNEKKGDGLTEWAIIKLLLNSIIIEISVTVVVVVVVVAVTVAFCYFYYC